MANARRDLAIRKTGIDLEALHLVATPRNHTLIFRSFGVTLGLVFIALAVMPWQQTALSHGRVVAYSPVDRRQDINSPIEGRIQRWHVVEGSRVKAGDLIVELSDNDPEILERLRLERSALEKRVRAASLAVQTARINIDRQKVLFEKGLSAKRAYEQANLEYTRYLVEEANASAELARIDVRLSRQMTQSVRSPSDGTILRIRAGQGAQIVKAGETVAELIPETDSRAVELWVSGNDMPLVYEGRKVRLQFEGWPALQFSGWPSVAIGTFGGKVALVDAADNGQGKFRILVVPEEGEQWPEPRYLRQGVRAVGWVLLDEVSLGYELWRQFNGFPPSSKNPPAVTTYPTANVHGKATK
jgi:multidrug efflux pump subunit AcrA (membrane-fusion protein)